MGDDRPAPRPLSDPVAALRGLLAAAGSRPRTLVALAGVPGAGKTTAAARLARDFEAATGQPGTMRVLGMDGFHLPKAALRAMPDPERAFARRGAPWTFDAAGLAARLGALRREAGRAAVPWPGFEHEVGDPVEAAVWVPPEARLILVEGLYLLLDSPGWAEVPAAFDERWFLDVPLPVARERLARRHMAAWGFTREQAEARIDTNDGINSELVWTTRARADGLLADEPFGPASEN